ncbi:BnaC03g47240D [Brassica napus]|uniref:BnaC03g47240D protein n=1 Tax=Brassica napus TaxID=3708 RepID=A0A078H105_BRANA|nr:BnaC03g47240D [Brassica napus]
MGSAKTQGTCSTRSKTYLKFGCLMQLWLR